MNDIYHVYPLNEEGEHVLNENAQHCECIPRFEKVHRGDELIGTIVVHNAMDHRDFGQSEALTDYIRNQLL